MKNWLVKRHGVSLGHFLAEELRFEGDTLYAIRGGRIFGCVAGGRGLTWESAALPKEPL